VQCLVCSCDTQSFLDESMDIWCYSCSNCGLIFKDPSHHQSFIEQKERYDLHENSSESDGYRRYFQNFLEFVMPVVGEPSRVLDFGCGESLLLSDMMIDRGMSCDYYDPVYHPSAEYRDSRYDLIVSVEVFEHLLDPMAVFTQLISLLHSGGYLAIRTELHSEDIEQYLRWYYPKDPTHVVFFSTDTFRHMCRVSDCQYVIDNAKNIIIIRKS